MDFGRVSGRKVREGSVWSQFSIRQRDQSVGEEDSGPMVRKVDSSEVSLRQWLDNPGRTVNALECLHIFSQIVHIVSLAHAEGSIFHNVKPSCFVLSSLDRVSFIKSASCSKLESYDHGSVDHQTAGFEEGPSSLILQESQANKHCESELVVLDSMIVTNNSSRAISQIRSETTGLQSGSGVSFHPVGAFGKDGIGLKMSCSPKKLILDMESSCYVSPEEAAGSPSCSTSDIYRLGILLFELFCAFSSLEEKISTMENLRHRVLPPNLLSKWPREASFCLLLLHPEPNCRPKINEILESDFLNERRGDTEQRDAAIELREKTEEHELLLEFLMLLQRRKQDEADSLKGTLSLLSSDIEEVSKLQADMRMNVTPIKDSGLGSLNPVEHYDSGSSGSRNRADKLIEESFEKEDGSNNANIPFLPKSSRLMSNFRELESAYFMTRRRFMKSASKPYARNSQRSSGGRGYSLHIDRSSSSSQSSKEKSNDSRQSGWIHSFLEGLCKYLTFSNLKVKAELRQGDLLNSSNLVSSLSFDCVGDFLATAGVNKKIKVFEYNSILRSDRDIHYPMVEMTSTSKLSSICWNGYIQSHIASSNFEGVVQVFDVTRSRSFMEMREHGRRVWSVDFSVADPTLLASGGDDGTVKLWNINQRVSVNTIQAKANVCCVKFAMNSGRSLAFGSADHKIYYYDLRNMKMPLYILAGHKKTVSYVKFADPTTLVSASTDNTLKLWDLSMGASGVIDSTLQSYTGHLNVKNFVGLSVSDGYIATGSETNEVYVYHKAFPMPASSFKFTDPHSTNEVDESSLFISSVCWRGQSSTLAAANSMGNIKILEMV